MTQEVKVRLSVGLVLLIAVHVALMIAAQSTMSQLAEPAVNQITLQLPSAESWTSGKPIERLTEPPITNMQAQGEMKQQCGIPCRQPVYHQQPVYRQPSVVYSQPHAVPAVVHRPAQPPVPMIMPVSNPTIMAPAATPAKKSFEIALFVQDDAQSRQLIDWFNRDPNLRELRSKCEFQTYTASNMLYRTRFAKIVPPEQFPVVLFQDSTGGHVHAAGRHMIPSTPGELYSDLQAGFEMYRQAKSAARTGAVKTTGYNWDDAITPMMQLNSSDCPDGYCPNDPPSDAWRPGDRIRDVLFDRAVDDGSSAIEKLIAQFAPIVVIGVCLLSLVVILIRRGV